MSQDITIIGSFRVNPGSQAEFDELHAQLEERLDEFEISLDEEDMVHIRVDENTSIHSASKVDELLANFIADCSVLGAATLQTGPDSRTYGTYGHYDDTNPKDLTLRLAQRDYITKQRDYWQGLLDNLEA